MRLLILVVGICCVTGQTTRKLFDGYKVYRTFPRTQQQMDIISKLENEVIDVDFWTSINKIGLPVDIMVPPLNQEAFVEFLLSNGIEHRVFIDNVQEKINAESIGSYSRAGRMTWTSYYRLEDIHAWMDSLAYTYPDNVTVVSGGRSYLERDIKGVKISFGPGRRSVFIEGGIHAREWISPATVTYLINELLTSDDESFRRMAESFDWYLFPSINPDGYVFTHDWYRLWRKTLSPTSRPYCRGADPNRNYDFHWGEEGTSTNPCSETYGGAEPFSEAETRSLSQFVRSIGSTIDVYISFHSYSQLLLIPYSHTDKHVENFDHLYTIASSAADALSQKYGTEYKVGNTAEILYAVSGDSADWAKFNFNIPIAFTYELRDTGEHGFLLPPEQITPNCEEVMDSLVAMFEESENLGYLKMI